jgi:hypothetical protein
MEDFSGSDATAFTPTTTTTARPDTKQAPAAPAPTLQDSTTPTLATPVSATPNHANPGQAAHAPAPQDTTTPTLATPASAIPDHASPGQAAQLHAEPTSVAPNDIIVNTATATDSNATAAANQSIAAAEMSSLERLKQISANDTKQNSGENHGIAKSAGADNADEDETTHEVAKSSDNTANDDTAGSGGDENVSNEGADEVADEDADDDEDDDADGMPTRMKTRMKTGMKMMMRMRWKSLPGTSRSSTELPTIGFDEAQVTRYERDVPHGEDPGRDWNQRCDQVWQSRKASMGLRTALKMS